MTVYAPLVLRAGQSMAAGAAGAAGCRTSRLAVALRLPPAPVQVTLTRNVPADVRVNVFFPEVAVEPMAGEPAQRVACFDFQVSVALPPAVIDAGENDAVTVGGGFTSTLASS